jgi:hypothetical protein
LAAHGNAIAGTAASIRENTTGSPVNYDQYTDRSLFGQQAWFFACDFIGGDSLSGTTGHRLTTVTAIAPSRAMKSLEPRRSE